MNAQWWSWILTIIGLIGFFLAGKKVWWAWYINILNQFVWFAYALITEQWGFMVGVVAYTFVFTKNAVSWTKEHNEEKENSNTKYEQEMKYLAHGTLKKRNNNGEDA